MATIKQNAFKALKNVYKSNITSLNASNLLDLAKASLESEQEQDDNAVAAATAQATAQAAAATNLQTLMTTAGFSSDGNYTVDDLKKIYNEKKESLGDKDDSYIEGKYALEGADGVKQYFKLYY